MRVTFCWNAMHVERLRSVQASVVIVEVMRVVLVKVRVFVDII